MNQGLFVSFEGSEGCGKSTQIARLRQRFEASGQRCEVVREPGGTALGETIRHLLKFAPEGENMTPEAELLLFAASRAQLTREIIRPWLAGGVNVIADRFLDSSVVYQGVARGLGREPVRQINTFAAGDCLPNLTILLDMDAKAAISRAKTRGEARDRMESEELTFYESVRQGYLDLAREEPHRIVVFDATGLIDALADNIWSTLTERFHGLSG